MDVRNCPECGKIFTFIRTNLCPACQKKDEEAFHVVRSFLAKHFGADIVTVAENTGISEENIMRYVRDGRISMGLEKGMPENKCEICGLLISHGRLCKACSDKLSAGLKRSIREENKKAVEEQAQKEQAQKGQGKAPRMYTAEHWLNRQR